MAVNKQLRLGIKVEGEHKDTVRLIRKYVKAYGVVPSEQIIFKQIAKNHLREDKNYYKKLKAAKL